MEPVDAVDGQDATIGPLSWRMNLRIISGPPSLSTQCPPSTVAPPVVPAVRDMHPFNTVQQAAEEPESQQQQAESARAGRLGSLSGQQRQERLYQVTAVAASEGLRAAAEAASLKDWAARSVNTPADVALLKDALRWAPRDNCFELQRLAAPSPAVWCL